VPNPNAQAGNLDQAGRYSARRAPVAQWIEQRFSGAYGPRLAAEVTHAAACVDAVPVFA